ncbi:MAG TPA: head GIN domain-containing protein [Croceibacterium sp.]
MSPPASGRPRLRKREVLFAVAAGVLAAGAAALILDNDDEGPTIAVTAEDSGTRTYELAPFAQLATFGAHDVVIEYGETQSVRAEGPANALAGIEAAVRDGRLTIRPNGIPQFSDWGGFGEVTYYVTLPRLESVTLSGPGDVSIDRIEGESFSGSVRGPGELTIEALQVDDAEFAVRGPGQIAAAGTAGKTRVTIEGPGEVDAEELTSATAMVTVSGPGELELTVDDDAQVSVTGGGNVDIAGTASCTVSRAGTGNVRCGEGD